MDLILGVLRIPIVTHASQLGSGPKVSIIFAARNEARSLRPALESMLAQDYPDYEVIAVNDRSTDETLQIMKSLPSSRLQIHSVESLPSGWLGKNHALYQGYLKAQGEYLLFTDADIAFHPNALTAAMAQVQKHKLDHLVLFPEIIADRFLEKLFTAAFGVAFFRRFRPWAAQNPKSKAFAGVGAFNLVKRSAYETIGTHQKLALQVLDDMILGRSIKRAGFRQTVMSGIRLLTVPWVQGFQGVLKAIEKNAFAGLEYSISLVCLITVLSFLFDVLPLFLLFSKDPAVRFFAGGSIAMLAAVYGACRLKISGSFWMFVFHPLGSLLLLFLIWRAVILNLRAGGIRWRETFYSLDQLRNAP
jgi:glycosyltransferase involved in cell wall biosynthesis